MVLPEDDFKISESSSYYSAPSGSARFENGVHAPSGVCENKLFILQMVLEQVNLIHEIPAYGKIEKKCKITPP